MHPVRVDAEGAFLSYELWPRALRKRAVSARRAARAFYELQFRGRALRFHLAANAHLLAPGFVCETRRRGGLGRAHIRTHAPACHLLGDVQDPELEGGLAAISACDGLVSAWLPPWLQKGTDQADLLVLGYLAGAPQLSWEPQSSSGQQSNSPIGQAGRVGAPGGGTALRISVCGLCTLSSSENS